MNNQDTILVMPLGGLEQIGANCTLIGYNDSWIMVDLGISFFDKLGIEVLTPDISFAESLKNRLKAIFVTHAHEDHIGAIHYFWNNIKCPVYLTEFSAQVLKQKLAERKIETNKSRVVTVATRSPVLVDNFKVEFVSLSHSILGACGIYIKTPIGSVFHTGDWKIDETPLLGDAVDEERLKEIGKEGIDCLLCDSTNVLVEGEIGSENDVKQTLDKLIPKYKDKRITITCFASNVARLATIMELARKYKRKVVVVGRSIDRMLKAVANTAYFTKQFKADIEALVKDEQAGSMPPERVLMVCTGSQGEARSALFRLARGENRVLKLGRRDVVLFSSKVIPGNEICIRDMQNLLVKKGVQIVSSESEPDIHVSGHPNRAALKKMYGWLKPKALIPLHGDPVMLNAHDQFARECGIRNTIVISSGDMVSIQKDTAELKKIRHVNVVYNVLDGKHIIPMNSICIRERYALSYNGSLSVSCVVESGKIKNIDFSMHGVYATRGAYRTMKTNISRILNNLILKGNDDSTIKREGSEEIRRLVNGFSEKKPVVDVYIHRI